MSDGEHRHRDDISVAPAVLNNQIHPCDWRFIRHEHDNCLSCIMLNYQERLYIDPEVRFGKPCIRGTRISVYDVLSWFASGMSREEILQDFPELSEEDIQAVWAYAADREHSLMIAS